MIAQSRSNYLPGCYAGEGHAMPNAIPNTLPETGFLRQSQVLSFIPISKSTLWRRVAAGSFPTPVKLSERVTAWRAEDVRIWIESQGQSQ
jgi:predicted DNA-binding transcriptional regulator AlpA